MYSRCLWSSTMISLTTENCTFTGRQLSDLTSFKVVILILRYIFKKKKVATNEITTWH